MKTNFSVTTLALTLAFGALALATPSTQAQVAGGSTTVGVSITETTQLATGWSVKKTLLGKTVYNEAGTAVGKVQDLIVAPDRNVSYVIVGAGGFIGIGRHDVAVPIAQIVDQGGRLVMNGATKDAIKAMPTFNYAQDTGQRARFVAQAERDIAAGKVRVHALEQSASTAVTDAKAKLDIEVRSLQDDIKAADAKLSEMKQASAARWKEFEAGVSAATARLRKAMA